MSYKRHPWLITISDRKCDPVTALRRRATRRRQKLLAVPRDTSRGTYGAIDDLREVVAARPEEVGALHAQATLLLNVQRNLEAKALLERALKVDPTHALSLTDMANVLVRLKKPEMALKFASAAVSVAPHSASAYNAVAASLARQEKYGLALKACNKALFFEPHNASVHRNLAAIYAAQGKNNKAIVHYEQVHKLDNQDVSNCMLYMKALVTEGRSDETTKLAARYNKLTGSKYIRE